MTGRSYYIREVTQMSYSNDTQPEILRQLTGRGWSVVGRWTDTAGLTWLDDPQLVDCFSIGDIVIFPSGVKVIGEWDAFLDRRDVTIEYNAHMAQLAIDEKNAAPLVELIAIAAEAEEFLEAELEKARANARKLEGMTYRQVVQIDDDIPITVAK
jgi:hypothetical protein